MLPVETVKDVGTRSIDMLISGGGATELIAWAKLAEDGDLDSFLRAIGTTITTVQPAFRGLSALVAACAPSPDLAKCLRLAAETGFAGIERDPWPDELNDGYDRHYLFCAQSQGVKS